MLDNADEDTSHMDFVMDKATRGSISPVRARGPVSPFSTSSSRSINPLLQDPVADNRLSPNSRATVLNAAFDIIDTDHDGKITPAEFRAYEYAQNALPVPQLQQPTGRRAYEHARGA